MSTTWKKEALEYHSGKRPGKIEVVPTKPCATQRDLSLAYTPGVAEPCLEIKDDPNKVFEYTARGNLVAVISDGTAVLGLGNIGPLASKPVMEGKGVLFKRFAAIDVFDIEVNEHDPDKFVDIVASLEPTFGGINLEDIAAPHCFYIEKRLIERMSIPIFHDDQHGTAIISAAGLLNALELQKKKIDEATIVFSGAGAAAVACAELYTEFGAKKENIILVDTKGVIYKGRTKGMNAQKQEWASDTKARTLEDAMKGADVFVGLSIGGLVTQDMVRSMADRPIVFAMANPDPEIAYDDARAARPDIVMATGRSDYPNQVNNVLGFPFIFRGALDSSSTVINMEMKKAASKALADLTREDVPDTVLRAYNLKSLGFGPDYIIPKPFDPRVLIWEASAVAEAATRSGVARRPMTDLGAYRDSLEKLVSRTYELTRPIMLKAKASPKRIVFPEGDNLQIIRACAQLVSEGICRPMLIGPGKSVESMLRTADVPLSSVDIVDSVDSPEFEAYAAEMAKVRQRKGVTIVDSRRLLRRRNYFASMMLRAGEGDGLISGVTKHYPETIRPALELIPLKEAESIVSGVYVMLLKSRTLFFADTTVNMDPTDEQLAQIAIQTAETAKFFGVQKPQIAMISFSNFGSVRHPFSDKVARATAIAKERAPGLPIEGEMQVDTALNPETLQELYPFSSLKGGANVLIFPNLHTGNSAYKLVRELAGAEAIGPILQGISRPVNVLQRNSTVAEIVNLTAITVLQAQAHK